MNVVLRHTFDRLDIPTCIRRNFADREPRLNTRERFEAAFIHFIARVSTGDIFWR